MIHSELAQPLAGFNAGGGGTDTSDATAVAGDILDTKTAYVASGKVTGSLVPLDTSDATAAASNIEASYTAYGSAGTKLTGTMDLASLTALQHHVKSGKTARIASGQVTGNAFTPATMKYDGSTGTYAKTSLTVAGNKVTMLARFKYPTFTGDVFKPIVRACGPTSSRVRLALAFFSTNYTGLPNRQGRLQLYATSSTDTVLLRLLSSTAFLDDTMHTCFMSYDADIGAATFIIDGANADDTGNADRVAPATGSMETGSGTFYVGSDAGAAGFGNGDIGFCGMREAYLTNWSDFMRSDGSPKAIDESGWTEWGAQPKFWNKHGDMVNNLGSGGAMTKNGTINVGDGGN